MICMTSRIGVTNAPEPVAPSGDDPERDADEERDEDRGRASGRGSAIAGVPEPEDAEHREPAAASSASRQPPKISAERAGDGDDAGQPRREPGQH